MVLQDNDQTKEPMGPYQWPARKDTAVIGKDHDRLDGLVKSTGAAKYTYDVNLKNQLTAVALGCPHSHVRIKSVDSTVAEKVDGVVHVEVLEQGKEGKEVRWAGELLVVVAAESEGAAREGVANIKIEYEMLDVFTADDDLEAAQRAKRTTKGGNRIETEKEPGDDDDEDEFYEKEFVRLFKDAEIVHEGEYGIDAITHCCLEPHGATAVWEGDKLVVYLSTQNVSGTDDQFAGALGVTANDVEVRCEYIGGGFGSKFAPDYWGIAAARIAKKTGRPVRLMLDRDQELRIGGSRPSGYVKVKVGADKTGKLSVWDSHHWGTGGSGRGAVSIGVVPYVMVPPNRRSIATNINTYNAPVRAWRAPNHPQGCALSQTVIDDVAGKLGKDSYDVFMANLANCTNGKAEVYADQMKVAARLMDWKAKWHPHGKGAVKGSVVDGLGMGLHTWGGAAHPSTCTLKIHPDGSVESFLGSQDLGSGTRTICAQVLAETLGLKVADVTVNLGSSKYPISGPSGGSTTVGGVSQSHRRSAQDGLQKLFVLVAAKLGAKASDLVAAGGRIQTADGNKSLSWKQACSLLGVTPLETTRSHERGKDGALSSSGVAGVQMAHVSVDKDTGVIRVNKFVAVQDQGLVINPKTCKSQISGAVIMGIAASIYEQRVNDPRTGLFLNSGSFDRDGYGLARLGDVGDIVVELYEPESERSRGVIGNGEPPAISPKTAISNAVANALGVRVPVVPMTPKRVLDALAKAAGKA
ncbi:MAG: xanthine dehydrogenase family protein molybdopterin-binding subunit [Pirellulales bacterium]|nr:xanthine dehydrogenase family protein molybdopterin-binding subunit [Pirellulales bacterium]